ncbi:MAG: hypothetical protein ACOC44_17765 [Promethearchaeia archaeon]
MTRVTFLLEAEEEMNFSAQFYNQKVLGLGLDFLEEIERLLFSYYKTIKTNYNHTHQRADK